MYHEVHVPKSLISKIFEPFLKSCTVEVCVPRGRVPRGLTVFLNFLSYGLKMAFGAKLDAWFWYKVVN